MNMRKSLKLMDKYAKCPECGNDKVGDGQGGIIVEDDYFRRFCNCGFDITIDEDENKLEVANCSVCGNHTLKSDLKVCAICKSSFCTYCVNDEYEDGAVCRNCYID